MRSQLSVSGTNPLDPVTDLDLVNINSFVLLLHCLVGHLHRVDSSHLSGSADLHKGRPRETVAGGP